MKKLYGVITAMTTPFTEDGKVDLEAMAKQAEFLIGKGVNCLYPCGTTGEMYLMSEEERKQIAETVVKTAAGRVTTFIHCGAMHEDEVVRLCLHAHEIGADGVGIVTPNYFTVDNRAMVEYYRRICAQLPKGFPVYVYVIPQLAHNDVTARPCRRSPMRARTMSSASSTPSRICAASSSTARSTTASSPSSSDRTICSSRR